MPIYKTWMATPLLILCTLPLVATPIEIHPTVLPDSIAPKEIERWEQVMKITERNSERQKQIYALLLKYRDLQAKTDSPSSEELYQRAQVAYELQTLIQDYHLEPLFSKDFIEELQLFGQVGAKRGIPQP